MTEEEWLNCTEPQAMLEFLQKTGQVSNRKLRLFAVACSRRIWDLIDTLGRVAVDVAEEFADRFAGPEEMRAARLACQGSGGQSAWYAAGTNPAIAARNASRSAQTGVANSSLIGSETAEILAQAVLLRDIFGQSLFHALPVDPSLLAHAVVELAQGIYDNRSYDRMPLLADALEETGCTEADLLGHCRGLGPHVKGCWVVDLILGKE